MKQQETFDSIRDQHKMLLLRMDEPGGVDIEQVSAFLDKLAQAGTVVERAEDRSLLHELLRYWSSVINDKTGKFPVVQLYPFEFHNQLLKRKNHWKFATQVLLILLIIIIALATTATVFLSRIANFNVPIATPTAAAIQTATASVNGTVSASVNGTATASANGTASAVVGYAAIQPGPGCDTNGGIWTVQGISRITCGTQIAVSSTNALGYLYFQLPNNETFSLKNEISVLGNPTNSQCIGLAEQGVQTGFLVQYCGNGHWSIYTISSTDESIVQTLDQSLTSTRATVDISLTLKGTMLLFVIDNEMHEINGITPIRPIKVAIAYSSSDQSSILTNGFAYTVLPS